MDTREKIVSLEDLPSRLGHAQWLAVAGLFDPLTLAQARRLAQLSERGKCVLAIVEPSSGSLLAAEARAVLVAALRNVRLVVVAERAEWRAVLLSDLQIEVVEDWEGERKRSAEFVAHIQERQRAQ